MANFQAPRYFYVFQHKVFCRGTHGLYVVQLTVLLKVSQMNPSLRSVLIQIINKKKCSNIATNFEYLKDWIKSTSENGLSHWQYLSIERKLHYKWLITK